MYKLSATKRGFTLVEILVTVTIIVILLIFPAKMIINSQQLSSFSKHKVEAAFAAQQIIETERQNPFIVLAAGHSQTIGPSSVILDTKGNYINLNCATNSNIFCGNAVITVTPAVYTNSVGQQTTSTTVDHFVVLMSWNERVLKSNFIVTDTYAADIANDPMLN